MPCSRLLATPWVIPISYYWSTPESLGRGSFALPLFTFTVHVGQCVGQSKGIKMGVGPGSGVEVIGLSWGVYLICGLPLCNSLLKYGGLVQPPASES